MSLLVTWHVLASSLALGQVPTLFRDGQSPTPAYAGTRDATIHDGAETPWQPGVNYDGLDDFLGGAPDNASTLLRFDFSAVPPSTIIQSATLQVHLGADAPGQSFPIYQCLQPWTATGADWDRYDGVTTWAGAGASGAGDLAGQALGTLPTGSGGTVQVSLSDAGVALVQEWIAGTTPNHGFALQNYAAIGTVEMDRFNSGSFVDWPQLLLGLPDGGMQVVDAGEDTTIANARDPQTVNDNTDHLNADTRPKAAAFLAFDLSSIPPWSTVTSATLLLDCASDGTVQPYSIYASSRPWVETEACWNTWALGSPWGLPGADGPGDHGSTVLGTLTGIGAPLPVALNASGVQVVQDWIRGLAPNNGFEIVEYGPGSDGIMCHAREESTVSERPGFLVVYLEGQLGVGSTATAGGAGTAQGPITLERRRLDGVAIASGAPVLSVTVTSSSPTGGFAGDAGASTWLPLVTVSFPAGASTSNPFWMRDLSAGRPSVLVSAGIPWQPAQQVQSVRTVRVSAAAPGAYPVGDRVQVAFQAMDSADVTSPLSLSARLLRADGGLASTAAFTASNIGGLGTNQATGVAATGAAMLTVRDNRAETLQVCGSITSAPATELCTPVVFAFPDHLSLGLADGGTNYILEGCGPQTFRVQMEDDAGNPLASPSPASFCAPTDAGLVIGSSTFANESRTEACVNGTLGPDGSALVDVSPTFPVGVTLGAASSDVPDGDAVLGVRWVAGPTSPRNTDLMWRDGPDPMTMQVGRGVQVVRAIPRDECGFSALARSSETVLVLPGELLVGPSTPDFEAGALDTPIQLDACPPAAVNLSVRAVAANQPVVDEAGNPRTLTIVPQCAPAVVGVGCGGCAEGPNGARGTLALALALAAVTLRAARRRGRATARARTPQRRSAADP
ncbi:MAG TPA: DNRLRE domain-containing protein [Myxococcaceae bacterium]|jgi:hypothetical protein